MANASGEIKAYVAANSAGNADGRGLYDGIADGRGLYDGIAYDA
ncbi:MAG: hypothetical protein WC708_13295 [Lentisphaeria bacterium]